MEASLEEEDNEIAGGDTLLVVGASLGEGGNSTGVDSGAEGSA